MTPALADSALELRLTRDERDVAAAQALRYRVFVEEMGATVSRACHAVRREIDPFDDVCEHLVVIDHAASSPGHPAVVGAYRLLRRSVAERAGGFYTAGEYDLGSLLATRGEVLELGRSCVVPAHRGGHVVQLLWRGLCNYIDRHDVDVMFGCASLPGTDPEAVAQALSWLHLHHRAPASFRPSALPACRVAMDILAPADIDETLARRQLPPLLKGYLLAGAMVGDGACLDRDFNTIDVCVLLPSERVRQRNRKRFERPVRQPILAAA
ncbi:MAG TPA: GNAT family N-acyltransferase [Geminicoccus sp.]|uniref:GNAT family N-acetyltransferase n=1 Tax=Geminicoccus sp. TaxID=2024832 RepID=UPI002E2F76FB|nr:GNAT family N-acyltransferase [Geminicoccus sp.]HEX2526711.1 GNAT family N-acyltransferase [Geminicoccus sp.]